jgi:hypothetical protein
MAVAACPRPIKSRPVPVCAGEQGSGWMVVDAGSVVVHVFLDSSRDEYDLEGLWGREHGGEIVRIAPRETAQTLQSMQA